MKKIERKIIASLSILIISIIVGFSLLSLIYNGSALLEAIVAIVVIVVLIVLLVLLKNFYHSFKDNN
ncbi:MAG: hypothetical protein PQJ49_11470 [Sphaerochaetaceae bacterium]|nr:hypothetical protein [Sphaerochaetaceae bacterium]MDC7238653.1 hypothetical protein [Sphaerochaetaceae bacterium]MDC7243462.1 hypothetical protein [Sphaerochaetaceae bacterium]MDC7250525.1 hypothetical protein [Sphaerochaetaceae bacterium]